MTVIQKVMAQKIRARGGKVFTFDKGHSMVLIFEHRALRQLERMRRHGSRKVKVAVRRAGSLLPTAAVATVRTSTTRANRAGSQEK